MNASRLIPGLRNKKGSPSLEPLTIEGFHFYITLANQSSTKQLIGQNNCLSVFVHKDSATVELCIELANRTYSLLKSQNRKHVLALLQSPLCQVLNSTVPYITSGMKERDLRFKKLFDVLQFYQLNSDWSLLHFAAYYKYEVNIESFPPEALENVQNSHRTSVLHVAASTGNIQLIRTLLKFLPDVYIFDSNNQTVMHYAMLGTAETVAELIQMPAFYEQLRYRDRLGNTPVDIANQMAKLEIFKILLTQGLTIKLLNLTLPTLFTSTSDEQDSANGRSTEVNVQEFYQDSTPYVQFEPKELADDFDIYSVHYGGCPLHWIDKWSTLKRLFKSKQFDLNYRNRIGDTPLLTLIKRIGLFAPMNAAIPAFIKFDPVPTSDLSSQCTLSTTSWLYLNSTAKSVSQSPDRFVWILRFLSRNADINASDVNGNTALHYAVFNCDLLVVKFLIMFGASLTATNKQNQTPLQLASKRMNEVRSLYNIANLRDIGGLLVMDKTLLKSASHVANSTQLRILWKNYLRVVCALHSQSTIEGKDCRTCKKVRPEKSSSYDSIDSLQADADYKKSMVVLNQFAKDLHKLLDSGNVDNSNGSKKKMEIEGIEETLLPNMLCLDGGMNLFCHESLIQSQILLELQQHLAEPLQSYFQIYTGNGFGAITAALLAINRNPNEIFTFYLKLREKVKLNCSNDSVLETLLQEEFGTEMTLKDVETNYKHHLVVNLIRVDTFPLPLVCMSSSDEKFNTWKLWEVCRASGAGTTMYSSYKDYSDSSILSENPTVDSLTYYYGYMEDKNVAEIPELKEWLEKAPTKSEEAESSLRPLGIVLSIGSSVNYPTDSDSNELKCEKSNPSSQESIFGTENLSKIQDLAMNILTDGDNHVPERARFWCESTGINYARLNVPKEKLIKPDEEDKFASYNSEPNIVLRTSRTVKVDFYTNNLMSVLWDVKVRLAKYRKEFVKVGKLLQAYEKARAEIRQAQTILTLNCE